MSSRRVLFTTTSGTGHLMPLVPVIEAVRSAGHTVVVAAPEESETKITDLGFDCLPFGGLPADDPQRIAVFARMGEIPEPEIEALIGREIFGRINTTAALPALLDTVRTWRPDVTVSESGEVAASIATEVAGVPWLRITPTLASLSGFDRHIAAGLVELRQEQGLAPDPVGDRLAAAPLVGYFPEAFEFPDETMPETLRIRDPRLGRRNATVEAMVYVTFGTESAGMPFLADLVHASFEATAELGLSAIVAVGRGVDLAQFGPLPAGVELVEWVDQGSVMARARALICHAGAGTTLAALAAGVPIVAVPMFADQPQIAERIAATGCGTVVSPGPDLSRDLARALRGVVTEPPAGCATMQALVAELTPVTAAVDRVEQMAGDRARARPTKD